MSRLTLLILSLTFFPSCSHVPTTSQPEDPIALAQAAFLFVEIKHGRLCEGEENCSPDIFGLSGSGFLVDYDGNGGMFAITAAHSCNSPFKESVSLIQVTSYDGVRRDAYVVESVTEFDICILHVPKINRPFLPLAQRAPRIGEPVFTVSAPLGIFSAGALLMFKGYSSGAMSKVISGYTIPSASGSSGSPILNERGEVVGMTSAKMKGFENFCLSPHYNLLKIIYGTLSSIKLDSSSDL